MAEQYDCPCRYCGDPITTRKEKGQWLPFEGKRRHFCKAKMKKGKGLSWSAVFAICAIGLLLLIVLFFRSLGG
jgi:hypothetical protein